MNNAHLHLVVNHLPIIFPIAGVILLLIGIFTKSESSKRNAYIIFFLGAAATIAAMSTGEGAEESVENLPGVTENLIKIHEEAAELFAGLSYFLGGISVVALLANFKNYAFSKFMPFIVGAFALITLFFAQKAGNSGGEIRHTEIRSGASIQNSETGQENGLPEAEKAGNDSDDD
ncbi:MAG: hypothetical protein K0M56_01790 [Kaistella sp.]|nr:hypothetical protein [Kaistella sp.]